MVHGTFPRQTQVIIKPGATGARELLKSVVLIFSDIFYFDRGGRNLVTRSEDRIELLN